MDKKIMPLNVASFSAKQKMTIVFNKIGNTVDIWFDDPKKEVMSEETGEEIILKKDKNNRVIGLEKLNFAPMKKSGFEIPEIKVAINEAA